MIFKDLTKDIPREIVNYLIKILMKAQNLPDCALRPPGSASIVIVYYCLQILPLHKEVETYISLDADYRQTIFSHTKPLPYKHKYKIQGYCDICQFGLGSNVQS